MPFNSIYEYIVYEADFNFIPLDDLFSQLYKILSSHEFDLVHETDDKINWYECKNCNAIVTIHNDGIYYNTLLLYKINIDDFMNHSCKDLIIHSILG